MANLDIIIRAQNLASAALKSVERDLQGLGSQSSFAAKGFSGLQSAVGVGMVAAAGVAVAGIGALAVGLAKSVSVAADFESQMNVLEVAARSSGTTMDDLSTAAIAVGSDTALVGISASEAADAMTNFYKAGLTTGEIFDDLNGYLDGTVELGGALRAAVDLAAASELDLAQASDVVAISMATFGLEAQDAARIANVLVGAADASLASVGGLADGLQNVGPVAAAMGMSLEDVSTALAILSTRGIQGAEAGTAMKSMLLNMQRPTKDVTTALDELGVALYKADGTMKPLPDVIGQLESAFIGLTDEQKNQYAQTLAGSYGLAAFNTLIGEGAGGWDKMTDAMSKAASAQEVAQARTKGFKAAMEQLQGGLESLMINVGTPLIQLFLTPAANAMTDLIGKLAVMAPSVEQVEAGYAALVTQGTALVTSIMAVIGPIAEAIGRYVEWSDVLIALGIVVASIVIPFLAGIVAAAAPVIVVAAALVAAVALVRTAWEKDWGGIQKKTAAAVEFLKGMFAQLSTWMQGNLPGALATLQKKWAEAWTAIQAGVSRLVEFFSPALNRIKEGLATASKSFAPMGEKLADLWDAVQPLVQALARALGVLLVGQLDVLLNAFAAIMPAIAVIVGVFVDQLTAFFTALTDLWAATVALFAALVDGDWAGAWTAAGAIVQIFADYWKITLDNLLAVGIAIFTAIKDTIVNTLTDMGVDVGGIQETIQTAWETFLNNVATLLDTKAAAIQTAWETFLNNVATLLDTKAAAIQTAWETFLSSMSTQLDTAIAALKTAWDSGWESIKATLVAAVGVITSTLDSIVDFLDNLIPTAINTFKVFLGNLSLPNPFSVINDTISGIQVAIDRAKAAIESFKNWLGSLRIPNPFSGLSLPSIPSFSNPFSSNAAGSGFFPGGLTLVGERGPELVALPRGSRIDSSERTERKLGDGVTVNLYATVSNQMDVEELAWRVANTIQRRGR